MVKVAIVGLGFMGKMHLGIYLNKLQDVKVTAICDENINSLNIKNLASKGNIKISEGVVDLSGIEKYKNYELMLKNGGFDFVDICLPTFLHKNAIIKALEANYHVFCEKPLALTLEEGNKIMEKVKETGKLFAVGQCLRYWPAYSAIKKLIDKGKYGKVSYAEFARFSATPEWAWKSWLLDNNKSGNAALDLHIHDVDMVLYLFGRPKSVRSAGVFWQNESIAHITTIYRYNDKLVSSTGGWICTKSYGFNMRAFYILKEATIELDFSKSPIVNIFPNKGKPYALTLAEDDGYYYELKDFVKSIAKGRLSGIVNVETAFESLEVCLSEIDSAKTKKEIFL